MINPWSYILSTVFKARREMATSRTKRSIKKDFYIFLVGIFFSFSAYRAALDLQTSVNIENGLGSATGFANFGTCVLSSLTIAPAILKRIGLKKIVVICEVFYLLFIAANNYAVFATMIPASVLVGFGDSLMYPAMSLISVFYAIEYSKVGGAEMAQDHVHDFVGKCFGVFSLSRVSGNLLSYLVMRTTGFSYHSGNGTSQPNDTIDDIGAFCGANDCQDPNITGQHLSSYVATRTTTYILLGVFALCAIAAILIHSFGTAEIEPDENTVNIHHSQDSTHNEPRTITRSEIPAEKVKDDQAVTELIVRTLWTTLRQLKNPKQLLLSCLQIYAGMSVGFVMTELSRAYMSCMLGVQQVGLGMIAAGFLGCFGSFINGKLAALFGRNILIFIVFVIDSAGFMFCLLWQPTSDTAWISYLLCAAFGYTQGVWQSITNAMIADYFKKDQEVGFAAWNTFISAGIAIQFAWGPHLCVFVKLYASLAIMCTAVFLYGIAEYKYHRKPSGRGDTVQCSVGSVSYTAK